MDKFLEKVKENKGIIIGTVLSILASVAIVIIGRKQGEKHDN